MELKEMFVLPVWTQLTAMKGWATADKGLPKQQQLKPYGATAKLKTTTTFAEFHSFWSTAHDKDNQGSRTLIIITDKKYQEAKTCIGWLWETTRAPDDGTMMLKKRTNLCWKTQLSWQWSLSWHRGRSCHRIFSNVVFYHFGRRSGYITYRQNQPTILKCEHILFFFRFKSIVLSCPGNSIL